MENETREGKTVGRTLLKIRDFRLLWIGQSVSLLGDQFYLIALPWLVLQLTGDGLAVGTVLAVAGVPRALFMLLGGVLTDRFSPRRLMLASDALRFVLVGLLAALVFTGAVQVWMLYALALVFGLIDAFFYPAAGAIVPLVVSREHLQQANAMVNGTGQVVMFAGPALAGLTIALLGAGVTATATGDMTGIALAFAFDALTFVVSALSLWRMRAGRDDQVRETDRSADGLLSSIAGLVSQVWNDAPLRTTILFIAGINFLIIGPFEVGIPLLARSRFAEGAMAFGLITSSYGCGAFVGNALAAVLPRPAPRRFGPVLYLITGTLGVMLAFIGFARSTEVAVLFTLLMGVANGYVVILFMTWLQLRTPESMLGRMMSLIYFASVGLQPVSTSLAGAVMGSGATITFLVAGILMTLFSLAVAGSRNVRNIGLELSPVPVGSD